MSFLKNALENGIRRGVSNAVGEAVKKAVQPKADELANKAADKLDDAARKAADQMQTTGQAANQAASEAAGETAKAGEELGTGFARLAQTMENYANNAAKNMKICPNCENPASADTTFCPRCGAKLPELTLGQGALCPSCGKQNTIGTKFCIDCGTKLPFAVEEEKAAADRDAAVLAKWTEILPAYPVWNCGGKEYRLEDLGGYYEFAATFENVAAAEEAVVKFRELLQANGFRQAGEYPCKEHLYKMVDGQCYHVDSEHCFESDDNEPFFYFNVQEPAGGFNYVKPEPKKSGWRGLFGI